MQAAQFNQCNGVMGTRLQKFVVHQSLGAVTGVEGRGTDTTVIQAGPLRVPLFSCGCFSRAPPWPILFPSPQTRNILLHRFKKRNKTQRGETLPSCVTPFTGRYRELACDGGITKSNCSLTHKLTSFFSKRTIFTELFFFSLMSRLLSALHNFSCPVLTLICEAVLSRALTHHRQSLYLPLKHPLDRGSPQCSVYLLLPVTIYTLI